VLPIGAKGFMNMKDRPDYKNLTDSELVKLWQMQRDKKALNNLIEKHYVIIFRRIKNKVANVEDAREVTQDAFTKLVTSLSKYSDQGKFTHYLNSLVSSQLIDYYRKNGKDYDEDAIRHELYDDLNSRNDGSGVLAEQLYTEKKVARLTEQWIPNLPPNERLAFLLLHESELWDFETPLEWSHIATLNGIDKKTAWKRFESARESLMKGVKANQVEREDMLIFLVWTQAKRPFKTSPPLAHFAELLGVEHQRLRNWSHKAKKNLEQCLIQYSESS